MGSQTPPVMLSPSSQPDFITLKIVVPASSVCKTVRLSTKLKVKELHDIFSKKLSTFANTAQHTYEDYGFYWHSDSGPVWLAEASALRAYSFKPNVAIEFKKRTVASPTVKAHKSKGKKDKESKLRIDKTDSKKKVNENIPLSPLASPQTISQVQQLETLQLETSQRPATPPHESSYSLRKKVSSWVTSRPGSMYDHKKEKEKVAKSDLKKERSQSVNLLPRKDPDAVVNAARFTSPSFSSTFETSPPSSPREGVSSSLDDLDALIDGFDELGDEPYNPDDLLNEERLLEEYAAGIENEDIEQDEEEPDQQNLLHQSYSSSPSPIESPPPGPVNGRPRSFSSPRTAPHFSSAKYVHSTPASPDNFLDTSGSMEDYTKMPGLRGNSGKRDNGPSTNTARVAAVTSILQDALEGIDKNEVDMSLMGHYLTSALCILRTINYL